MQKLSGEEVIGLFAGNWILSAVLSISIREQEMTSSALKSTCWLQVLQWFSSPASSDLWCGNQPRLLQDLLIKMISVFGCSVPWEINSYYFVISEFLAASAICLPEGERAAKAEINHRTDSPGEDKWRDGEQEQCSKQKGIKDFFLFKQLFFSSARRQWVFVGTKDSPTWAALMPSAFRD